MTVDRSPAFLRRFARLLIRGSEARYIRADMEDAFESDLARGIPVRRAQWRYVFNILASALCTWRDALHPSAGFGVSRIDVKLALRMLVKYPGLTCVAVFALSIGIPAGIAPLHVANAIEAPLPVQESNRLRALLYWSADNRVPTTFDDFARWRDTLTSFETLAAWRAATYNVEAAGTVAPVTGAEVTASTFEVLRARAAHGRVLQPSDETTGGPLVAVIGHDLWRSGFGGDIGIIGRAIRIGDSRYTVVGVMPEDFFFPARQQLWLPLRERFAAGPRQPRRPLAIFGRLADGVSPGEAQAEVNATGGRPQAQAQTRAPLTAVVAPAPHMVIGFPKGGMRAQPEFRLVQILAIVPLLVACLNVGLLIAARTAARSSEFAVRTALGASRRRIVSQAFTEALVLAVLATGMGLLLFQALVSRYAPSALGSLPHWIDPGLAAATVFQALGLAVASAVAAGVVPALWLTARPVQPSIQHAGAQRSGVRFGGWPGALIVVDVAIAVAAVGFTAALAHKVNDVMTPNAAGIQAGQFLSAELRLPGIETSPGAGGPDAREFKARLAAIQRRLVERLEEEPGVRDVVIADALPRMQHAIRSIEVEQAEAYTGSNRLKVRAARVAPGFFSALDQPLVAGRPFNSGDLRDGAANVIVNTTFVEKALNGENPIGRRVRYLSSPGEKPGPWYEIVGVVGHLGMHVLMPDDDQGLYHPAAPGAIYPVQLGIHVAGNPESFTPRLRQIAHEVDPFAAISSPAALDTVVEGDWYLVAAAAMGGVVLVGILLTLAASAIFSLLSFAVTQRTREIGIRVALGADRRNIATVIAQRALAQVGLGVLLGMPLAGWLFYAILEDRGVSHAGWSGTLLAIVLGVGVLALIGLAACAVPTARALRIRPGEAMKVY